MKNRKRQITLILGFVSCVLCPVSDTWAEDKEWIGIGDGVSWEDSTNWSPAGKPSLADKVTIDSNDAQVVVAETFKAKFLIIGGRETSSFFVQEFVSGDITPTEKTDDALYIHKGGSVKLTGPGTITLNGTFRNTEKALETEPAFMFTVE